MRTCKYHNLDMWTYFFWLFVCTFVCTSFPAVKYTISFQPIIWHVPNKEGLFVVCEGSDVGLIASKAGHWKCLVCTTSHPCHHSYFVRRHQEAIDDDMLDLLNQYLHPDLKERPKYYLTCISNRPIPFSVPAFTHRGSQYYDNKDHAHLYPLRRRSCSCFVPPVAVPKYSSVIVTLSKCIPCEGKCFLRSSNKHDVIVYVLLTLHLINPVKCFSHCHPIILRL